MRTIQYIVKELKNEKLIIKQNGKFYKARDSKMDNPYMYEKYGKIVLEETLNLSNLYSEKQLTHQLISRFGLIILFNFIIAYQDINDNSKNKIINFYDGNDVSWLKNVISIDNMYDHFKKIIEQDYFENKYDRNIAKTRKLLQIIESDYSSISSILSEIKKNL